MTQGLVHAFLAADHARLDALLRRAAADAEVIDREAYAQFRAGLLRHIAMEEKVLLPEARRLRAGDPLPTAKRLRADHGLLASLLVPPPTHAIVDAIAKVLAPHNRLEEGADGVYAACEALVGASDAELLARLQAVAAVPIARHVDSPGVHAHLARLLATKIP